LRTYKTTATANTLEKWKRTPNQRQSAASLGNIQGVCTPAQKPSRLFKTSDSQSKGFTCYGNGCTQTTVLVQISVDIQSCEAQGGRMTNEKQLRVALYARVSTQNGRQDTQNHQALDQMKTQAFLNQVKTQTDQYNRLLERYKTGSWPR
jgi:hypothetical protein